ncbi:MAG: tripartite tricarboxylate transporter substrate binding protein [Pseudomonadota bacterium]
MTFNTTRAVQRIMSSLGAAFVLSIGLNTSAIAQTGGYAKGTVKLIVTNAPGTAPDAIGRALTQGLQDIRGLPTIVETKVGVQGMLGGDFVVRSTPDGSALILGSDTLTTVLPHMPEKMSFDPLKDLRPIALVADAAYVLVANPSLKVKTLAEFVKAAKEKPGAIDYASTGVNSAHNRTMVQFMKVADIKLNHIPYGSTGPLPDVLGGTIPVMWSGLAGALAHIQSGKLVALAVSSAKRHPSMPNVATVAELGYPGFDEGNWFGVMAPAGMPDALASTIQKDILKIVDTPAFRDRMTLQGMTAHPGNQEAFIKLIQTDYARNKGRINVDPATK